MISSQVLDSYPQASFQELILRNSIERLFLEVQLFDYLDLSIIHLESIQLIIFTLRSPKNFTQNLPSFY